MHLKGEIVQAMRLHAPLAIGTRSAPRKRDHYMIPRRETRDRVPYRFHHAGALMSEHCGERRIVIAIPPVLVGLAHAAGNDFHQQLVRARLASLSLSMPNCPNRSRARAAVICLPGA